jgi:ferritin-like protein
MMNRGAFSFYAECITYRELKPEGSMASEGLHEASEELTPLTRDLHRAYVSLKEELEAIDWYNQRVDATADEALRSILAHNRDDEKEHASMVLEWIRRHDPAFDTQLKKYLFTTEPITERPDAPAAALPAGGRRWNG